MRNVETKRVERVLNRTVQCLVYADSIVLGCAQKNISETWKI